MLQPIISHIHACNFETVQKQIYDIDLGLRWHWKQR